MTVLILVVCISFLIMYKSFFIVTYINKKDCQDMDHSVKRKILISIIPSIINSILFIKNGLSFDFFSYFIIIIFITMIAYIDYCTKYVYEIISIPMIIISAIICTINLIMGNIDFYTLITIFIISMMLLLFSKLNYIGEGDVEVFISLSLVMSKYNILPIINIILSLGISGMVGILLIITRRIGLKYRKALCPSIAVSSYILLILI